MQVRLNAWRGDHGPGEVIDLDERAARAMLFYGTAHPVDDIDLQLDAAEAAAKSAPPAPKPPKDPAP